MFVETEEVFFLPFEGGGDRFIFYAPLRSYLALVRSEVEDAFVSPSPETASVRSQVLAHLRTRPRIDIMELHRAQRTRPPELSLALTDDCNLRCLYCHHSAGDPGRTTTMTDSFLEAVIQRFFETLAGSHARVTFAGGGEPTVAFDAMRFTIDRAKKLAARAGKVVSFRMATNGYYGREIREYVKHNFAHVSLSLDGPAHVQNRHRPLPGGRESFGPVFETAKDFVDSPLSVAFRATVSDYSCSRLIEIVDFFAQHFSGASVGLEALNPFGRACTDTQLKPPDKTVFAEALASAYRHAEGKPIILQSASVGQFENLRTIFCGAVGTPDLTVSTDGRLSCCTRENAPELFDVGCFDTSKGEFVTSPEKLFQIRQMNVFSYDECSNCFCKYHCAGDCPDLRLAGLRNCGANRLLGAYWLNRRLDPVSRRGLGKALGTESH